MEEYQLKRKWLAVGIILLFVATGIIPLVSSEPTLGRTVITVDDEPGDADYISIYDALNHSSPSDIIEVYSGTYYEHRINITVEGISLIGIPYELGNGGDTGKPFINGNGSYGKVIHVDATNVTVSGFCILNHGGESILDVYYKADGCVISNNYLRHASNYAISLCSNYSKITNNTIRDTYIGIGLAIYGHNLVSDNIIENCGKGIDLGWGGSFDTIIRNRVSNCSMSGIIVGGIENLFQFNTLENNFFGLYIYYSQRCFIFQNNFFNNTYDSIFLEGSGPILGNHWLLNYWEKPRLLPYPILGRAFVFLPWVKFDWRPALRPYDIPGMR